MSWKVRLKSSSTEQTITDFPTEQAARDWVYKSVAVGDGYKVEVLEEDREIGPFDTITAHAIREAAAAMLAPPPPAEFTRCTWDQVAERLGHGIIAPADGMTSRDVEVARAAMLAPPSMTALEVIRLRDERLLALAPVLKRMEQELLLPVIRRTLAILLSDPPPRANRPHKAHCRHGGPWWRDDCSGCLNERMRPSAILVLCHACNGLRELGEDCLCKVAR